MKTTTVGLPEGWTAETIRTTQAGRYHMANQESVATPAELVAENISIAKDIDYPGHEGQAGFYIFADRSLYFWNNGQNEVWADFSDFTNEHGEDDAELCALIEG